MRRHLLGFALFNLIVGTALMVAILTGNFPKRHTSYVYEVSRESCWRGVRQNPETPKNYERRQNSLKITQAVLNEKTGKLNISFEVQRGNPATQSVKAKLVFIDDLSKEQRNWDKIIGTDLIMFSPDFDTSNKAAFTTTSSYSWLNNLKNNKNLYVYVEETETFDESSGSFYKTNYSESVPILLMNNK